MKARMERSPMFYDVNVTVRSQSFTEPCASSARRSQMFRILPVMAANLGIRDRAISCLSADPDDPYTAYVGTLDGTVWKTHDGGAMWRELDLGLRSPAGEINKLVIDPDDPYTIYASVDRIGVLRTRDGGETWEPVMAGLRSVPVYGEVLASEDGVLWDLMTDPLPADRAVRACAMGKGMLHLGTDGASVYTLPLPRATPVEEDMDDVPGVFALSQNVPNPFNAETTLRYELPDEGYVTLRIYDALGRRVATLMDARQPAGRYAVTWDARTGRGSETGSGIYFARLEVRTVEVRTVLRTRKMVAVR